MRNLFKSVRECLGNNEDVVLSTVVASSGSVPRGAGARMLTSKQGRVCGTVGGGAVEYACIVKSQEIISSEKKSSSHPFCLRKNDKEDLGMICGGDVTVYFSYLKANDENIKLLDKIEEFYKNDENSWLIIDITENGSGAITLYGKKSGFFGAEIDSSIVNELGTQTKKFEINNRVYYIEKLSDSSKVYIFGGGHVSQALVPVLVKLGFKCIVLEDREEFCKPELFEGVEKTILIDNNDIGKSLDIKEDDYICIMTRGHKADTISQAYAVKTPAHYIGLIGSRKKVEGVKAKLRSMGITEEEIARVTTPIGLDIKAETPEEIAISIAAQLILVRAERH